ncbi:hypothetical protein NQD34_006035, partial [Periophthalmus magnuspinnatus]
ICPYSELVVIPPNITMYPTWERDFLDSQVKLTCMLSGFYPDGLTVSWDTDSEPLLDSESIQRTLKSTSKSPSFTLSSQIEPDMTQWESGSNFTCTAVHRNMKHSQSINICKLIPNMPPAVHLETPSFQIIETAVSQITATCSVHSVVKASVTWLLDGQPSAYKSYETVKSTNVISYLDLSPHVWKKLSSLTCKAEHICLPTTEQRVDISEPPVSAPVVSIRRSLPDLLKGDRAVLECDITSMSSADLYVTFQSNGVDISSKDFVQLPKGSGLLSISRRFSVPKKHWTKDKHFSCKVSQGFSRKVTSTPTGSIFVEPSVKLLLAPCDESGYQTLLCTAWGFDPHIEWISETQRSSGSKVSISLNADGRVVVSSELQVPQTEWKTGKVYSCQVSDKSLNRINKENVSVCAGNVSNSSRTYESTIVYLIFFFLSVTPPASKVVGVYVQGPPLEELQQNATRLTVSCLLVGPSLDSFTVTWKINEQIESGGVHAEAPVLQSNGTQTLLSQLSLSAQDWHAHKRVTCEAKHLCSNHIFKEDTSKSREQFPPIVTLTHRDLNELSPLDPVSLDCLVSGFYPPEVIIFWEKNGIRIPSSSQTNAPVWKDKDNVKYSTSSHLNIFNTLDENSTYSCVVRHESSPAPFTSTITDVFASIIPTKPFTRLLNGHNKLACLVSGFSPAPINISWFLDNSTELRDYNTSEVLRGHDGKFSIQSWLHLTPTDMLPGALYTCRVTHATGTSDVHFIVEECNFLDYLLHTDLEQDTGVESWYMACVFLLCFLLSAVYCVGATLVKVR